MHIILDRTIAHVLRLFYATGCHFTGPIALRHSLSTALPYLILQYHFQYNTIFEKLSKKLGENLYKIKSLGFLRKSIKRYKEK